MSGSQRVRTSQGSGSDSGESGIQNERVLSLVFESMKWDIHALCSTASVNRKLRAVVNRVLWRDVCLHRAPRMISALTNGASNSRVAGGWHTLAKLMFFCSGCDSTRHFLLSQPASGHRVKASRFSKTSGQSFLTKSCKADLLYVSDVCEHETRGNEEQLGIYRGVFREFQKSMTRACLIERRVKLEESVVCAYCGAPVWSMTAARLVPKSAARRLGSHGRSTLEYFVCVNGHLHGSCWLVPLSSDEDEEEDGEENFDDGHRRIRHDDRTRMMNGSCGSSRSTGEEDVED